MAYKREAGKSGTTSPLRFLWPRSQVRDSVFHDLPERVSRDVHRGGQVTSTLARILIYKRTHDGDPDASGRFGIQDCMGRVRSFGFDGVIGVGGVSAWPVSQGIDKKVNWVGRRPLSVSNPVRGARAPVLEFARSDFALFERRGPRLADISPALASHVCGVRLRYFIVAIGDVLHEDACNLIAALLDEPLDNDLAPWTSKSRRRCRTGLRHLCKGETYE